MIRWRLVFLCLVLLATAVFCGCGGGSGSTNSGSSNPVSVSVATSATTVDGTDTVALTATVSNDRNAAGVSWSVSGGGALSNTSTTAATFTAPAATNAAQTVTVTATSAADASKSASATLTVLAQPAIATGNSALAGNVETAYSVQLSGSGGIAPYTWSVASGSTLPPGLSLSTAGLITGTPTLAAVGTSSVTISMKDSGTPTALTISKTFSFTIAYPAIRITTAATLPVAYVGNAHTQTLTATGGNGGPYTWSVPNGSTLPARLSLTGNVLSGTPTTQETKTFDLTVTDSAADSASLTFSLTVNAGIGITSASTLPTGYVGVAYAGAPLTAAGGNGSYSWTWTAASGSDLPPGLTFSTGGAINGTPTTAGAFSVVVTANDTAGNTASATVSLTVGATYSVSGNVYSNNGCGGNANLPVFTMTINTSSVQTATTDASGNYSFANVPNGNYTITPSSSAPSAAFVPATASVTVNGANLTQQNIGASVGYNVSGTVSYNGAQSGQVYLTLSGGCGMGSLGTSIPSSTLASGGGFTIHGVSPGTYTLKAVMDAQGYGFPINASFPSGKATGLVVATGNLTGQAVTMTDPASYAISGVPQVLAVPIDQGVLIHYSPITGTDSSGNPVEVPPYYQVQWNTSTTWSSPSSTNSFVFQAGAGDGSGVLIMNNLTAGSAGSPFANGSAYYFRMRGYFSNGNSNNGGWAYSGGNSAATAAAVTIGALSGTNTVSGAVSFSGSATGTLYVGFFSPTTGRYYGQRIVAPVSPQAYSVQVPDGSYYFIGIVDNDNNGLVGPGDFSDMHEAGGPPTVTIAGPASNMDLALPSENVTVTVTTQNTKQTTTNNTYQFYGVYFDLRYSNKVPLAVQLISGPNVALPVNIGRCPDCGAVQFQYGAPVGAAAPSAGDTYTFNVTYSDGTSEHVTGAVSTLLTAFATTLIPQQTNFGVSTTPAFSWNYPSSAGNYIYRFRLWDNSGNQIWQIPSSSSQASGFTSSQIPSTSGGSGIAWSVDPTNASNAPTVPSLTSGTTYSWSIETIDPNGNSATRQIYFVP